jgi:hypothetical protein
MVERGLKFESAAADVGHVVAEKADSGIGWDVSSRLVDLLFVDEHATRQYQCTSAFAALDEAAIYQEEIDADFAGEGQGFSSFPGSRFDARTVQRIRVRD